MGCGVGHRLGPDPELLWLWCRLAAVVPIRPLAWELPYAVGVALKKKKRKRSGGWQCHSDPHPRSTPLRSYSCYFLAAKLEQVPLLCSPCLPHSLSGSQHQPCTCSCAFQALHCVYSRLPCQALWGHPTQAHGSSQARDQS